MICNRLTWFLETRNLLSRFQCGSRKYHTTTDAHVYLTSAIHTAFLNRHHLVAVSFDLEKAFDMTWRHGILLKLHEWGLRGNLPLFVQQFLCDRTFSVRIGNTYSTPQNLENGVPQGSTASVILFLIAFNDIAANIPGSVYFCQYVDDLVIFTSAKTISLCQFRLQAAIDAISASARACGFRFSVEKTRCIDFCRLRRPHNPPILLMYGERVQCVTELKILGIIFDHHLTWGRHISVLASIVRKSLNAIKCLSNISWGSDRQTLVRLYQSLILSKMDFGCIAYSSAKRSHLKKLDVVHTAGIRYSSGAFRTSPVHSVLCESGVAPLHIRHMRLRMNYAVKVFSNPGHMNYDIIFRNQRALTLFRRRPSSTPPLCLTLRALLDKLPFGLEAVLPVRVSKYPPCKCPILRFDTTLSRLPKDSTPYSQYLAEFHSRLEVYSEYLQIFTDGSKSDSGTGCAFFVDGATFETPLSPTCSVFTAELYAIQRALQHCLGDRTGRDVLICTDSLSAISALTPLSSSDPCLQAILNIIFTLNSLSRSVTLMWVPSHVGISGNEAADQAACRAASCVYSDLVPVRPDDLRRVISDTCRSVWQSEWNSSGAKLRDVKPSVEKWNPAGQLSRREQVVLTRLRIGHTRLTHSYLLLGEPPPTCDVCNVHLSVRHILVFCNKYDTQRRDAGIVGDLADILADDPIKSRPLLSFLKSTGLFSAL